MDETTKQDLARRAVACPGWRWMPGMRATWPDDGRPARRYGSPDETSGWVSDYSGKERIGWTDADALPDLDDPATLGCLLALVREAWRDDSIHCASWMTSEGVVWWDAESRRDSVNAGLWRARGTIEAVALVAALEAAGGGS